MTTQFLSDQWFEQVAQAKAEFGNIEIPATLQDLVINITATDSDGGDKDFCLNSGFIEKGHHDDAATKMILPAELAHRIFVENDQSAGMQGFMSGQIKIEGDMSRLMSLQSVQPSDGQRQLQDKIKELTTM